MSGGVNFFPAIDRYIFRLVLMPMVTVFLIAASLLVLDKMLRLFEFVSSEAAIRNTATIGISTRRKI
jgi:lipopolysaccharide export LptBFGC system permease protein LptF